MKKDRDAYIVIAPTGKSKTHSIAARRLGSQDRYSVVATCQCAIVATQLVEGLRLRQGEVTLLETVAQRTLADVRAQLTAERTLHGTTRDKLRSEQLTHSGFERRIRELELQLGAAQKKAREEPARYMTSGPT